MKPFSLWASVNQKGTDFDLFKGKMGILYFLSKCIIKKSTLIDLFIADHYGEREAGPYKKPQKQKIVNTRGDVFTGVDSSKRTIFFRIRKILRKNMSPIGPRGKPVIFLCVIGWKSGSSAMESGALERRSNG